MTFRIIASDDIATILALRRVVFIEEQGVSEAEELDDLDAASLHLLALDEETPVGTAHMTVTDDKAKLGRVCVLKPWRGTGLGAALIRRAIQVARETPGVRRVVLGAQVHALGFYERLGFAAFGPVYDDAGIDHRDMVLLL